MTDRPPFHTMLADTLARNSTVVFNNTYVNFHPVSKVHIEYVIRVHTEDCERFKLCIVDGVQTHVLLPNETWTTYAYYLFIRPAVGDDDEQYKFETLDALIAHLDAWKPANLGETEPCAGAELGVAFYERFNAHAPDGTANTVPATFRSAWGLI